MSTAPHRTDDQHYADTRNTHVGNVGALGVTIRIAAVEAHDGVPLVQLRIATADSGEILASVRMGSGSLVMLLRTLLRAARTAGYDIDAEAITPKTRGESPDPTRAKR
jgi:hypothetical protein